MPRSRRSRRKQHASRIRHDSLNRRRRRIESERQRDVARRTRQRSPRDHRRSDASESEVRARSPDRRRNLLTRVTARRARERLPAVLVGRVHPASLSRPSRHLGTAIVAVDDAVLEPPDIADSDHCSTTSTSMREPRPDPPRSQIVRILDRRASRRRSGRRSRPRTTQDRVEERRLDVVRTRERHDQPLRDDQLRREHRRRPRLLRVSRFVRGER